MQTRSLDSSSHARVRSVQANADKRNQKRKTLSMKKAFPK
jgi:hypothetical protein